MINDIQGKPISVGSQIVVARNRNLHLYTVTSVGKRKGVAQSEKGVTITFNVNTGVMYRGTTVYSIFDPVIKNNWTLDMVNNYKKGQENLAKQEERVALLDREYQKYRSRISPDKVERLLAFLEKENI